MSDTEDHNPLMERLGAQRLAAPGVLSRGALERRYDDLTRAATPNGLVEKLHRRSAFSSNTGGSFVWSQARGSQSLGSEPMPVVSATPVQAPMSVIRRKAIADASPGPSGPSPVRTHDLSHTAWGEVTKEEVKLERGEVTSNPLASSTPALTLTPSPRSARERVGVRGSEQSAPVSAGPSSVSSAAAPTMIMRKEDPSAPRAPLPSSSPALRSLDSPTSRSPDSPTASASVAEISRAPLGAPLLTVLARKPANDAPSFLSRSISAPLVPAYRSAPSISARAPSSGASAASMLMRRLEDPRPTNTPHFGAPSVTPQRPSNQIAPQETKAAPSGPDDAAVESYGHHADNDALADQVSQRILRRLEIERERRGERSWR